MDVSIPNCLAYSAFSRCQPPNFIASPPTMRSMGVPLRRRSRTSKQMCQRAGTPVKPEDYEGIRLYWAPKDIHETRERLKSLGYVVSELEHRDYGQTEFFLTDDDGYSHCFGVLTQGRHLQATESNWESKRLLRMG